MQRQRQRESRGLKKFIKNKKEKEKEVERVLQKAMIAEIKELVTICANLVCIITKLDLLDWFQAIKASASLQNYWKQKRKIK